MRTFLLLGGLAAGVLFFVYEWYNSRESPHGPYSHGGSGPNMSEEDSLEIEEITNQTPRNRFRNRAKLPARDELCSVCQDYLIHRDAKKKYCIINLPCGHWFHQSCATRLLEYHPNCPVCRIPIDSSMLRSTPVLVSDNSTVLEASNGYNSTVTSNGDREDAYMSSSSSYCRLSRADSQDGSTKAKYR